MAKKVVFTVMIPVIIAVDSEERWQEHKEDIIKGVSQMGSRVFGGYYFYGTGKITKKDIRAQIEQQNIRQSVSAPVRKNKKEKLEEDRKRIHAQIKAARKR